MSSTFRASPRNPSTSLRRKRRIRSNSKRSTGGGDTDDGGSEGVDEDEEEQDSGSESDSSSNSSGVSSSKSNTLVNSLILNGNSNNNEGLVSPATSESETHSDHLAKQASASSLLESLDQPEPSTSAIPEQQETTIRPRQKSIRRSSAVSYDQNEAQERRPKRVQQDDESRPSLPVEVEEDTTDRPHVDLASYPTTQLLHLLAELLQQIANANENLRPAGQTTFPFPDPSPSNASTSALPDTAETTLSRVTPFITPFDMSNASEDYFPRQSPKRQSVPLHDVDMTSTTPSRPVRFEPYQPMSRSAKGYRDSAILTASKSALKSSSGTLCFHARNIPGIGIEQYLLRILKYCPTTNEVFIALLVYFDRMAQITQKAACGNLFPTPDSSPSKYHNPARIFAVDAYNIHRLLIAGVTVASKFFSDVFYTNSRYAKVGGLPLNELNQLELQFLLLNDFNLVVPLEEMQRYADGLLLYYKDSHSKPCLSTSLPSPNLKTSSNDPITPATMQKKPVRPSPALNHMRSYSNSMMSSTSESGSSTVGPRSDCSSVASTGTVRMESSRESSDVEDDVNSREREREDSPEMGSTRMEE